MLKSKEQIIGMIHLLPSPGHEGFESIEAILERAIEDLTLLTEAGITNIIVENNYDLPHNIEVGPETVSTMCYVIEKIKEQSSANIGISVLWNDYKTALALAKVCKCQFVRIPVFVDTVKTAFGTIKGESKKVLEYRNKIGARHIKIYTDIQVKHAETLNKRPIEEAALEALEKGSEGIIITGKWTGDPPTQEDLKAVREAIDEKIPVIVGSGADKDNAKELLNYCDKIIISTSLKEGSNQSADAERNIKPYKAKISRQKIKEFFDVIQK